VVNVSLPHIAGSLSATIDESTWVAHLVPGRQRDHPADDRLAREHFGRKRLLMASVIGFTARRSCAAGAQPRRCCLFRMSRAPPAARMQPLSQAVLLEAFPPHERGKAMGFWGSASSSRRFSAGARRMAHRHLQLALGVLHQHSRRHRSLVMTQASSSIRPTERRVEASTYWGIGLLALGIGALQIMLDLGQRDDWFQSNFILLLIVVTVAALVGVHRARARCDHPVVDLRVFKVRTSHAACSDDDAGIRPLWQPGAAADHAADAARLPAGPGRSLRWRRAGWDRSSGMPPSAF
jgi:DHA2 family multidrug resistance protein